MRMHKTSVEIDQDALHEAERVLGTKGYKATVNRALREVARRAALEHGARYVREGRLHLPSEDAWAAGRRPRG